ncbi:S1C family serine protease [Patescibacteria group bacterium]|nr:S1C family serine protease [Patescibacteria group bacterium]
MNKKFFLNLLIIFLLGGLGGVLAENFVLPKLAAIPLFSKIGFIRQAGSGTTIINPTERITITENAAIEDVVDRLSSRLVFIQSFSGSKLIGQGTGFIVIADGLIVTAADNLSTKATSYLIYRNSHSVTAQIVKTDTKSGLALLKINESNLPVVSFADSSQIRLGERVVLVGSELNNKELGKFVNLGIIRSIGSETLKLDLDENDPLANGGPLLNIKGEVIGLNLVGAAGLDQTILSETIKKFIEG